MGTNEPKTILVVDEANTTRKLLAGRLESMEFQVLEAGSDAEIASSLMGRPVDLVISEMRLPGVTMEQLFVKYKTLKTPLLVYTSQIPGEDAGEWRIAQVKGVFHKSQRAELLKKVLELAGWGAMPEAPEGAGGKHILLIEDSPTIRKMLRRILEKNFKDSVIREASEGREALSEMSNQKVDFIITDLQMPGMDGESFLKMLRRNPLLKNKPVIVLSSSITAALREELRDCSNIRLLPKPSSDTEITSVILELMNKEGKPCHL